MGLWAQAPPPPQQLLQDPPLLLDLGLRGQLLGQLRGRWSLVQWLQAAATEEAGLSLTHTAKTATTASVACCPDVIRSCRSHVGTHAPCVQHVAAAAPPNVTPPTSTSSTHNHNYKNTHTHTPEGTAGRVTVLVVAPPGAGMDDAACASLRPATCACPVAIASRASESSVKYCCKS